MRTLQYKNSQYRLAIDLTESPGQAPEPVESPSESKMVQDIEEAPAEEWRQYLQPIIKALRQQLGFDAFGSVQLLSPKLENTFGSPDYGFNIVGFVKTKEVVDQDQYGIAPYRFTATISPEGELVTPVDFVGVKTA